MPSITQLFSGSFSKKKKKRNCKENIILNVPHQRHSKDNSFIKWQLCHITRTSINVYVSQSVRSSQVHAIHSRHSKAQASKQTNTTYTRITQNISTKLERALKLRRKLICVILNLFSKTAERLWLTPETPIGVFVECLLPGLGNLTCSEWVVWGFEGFNKWNCWRCSYEVCKVLI